MSRYIKEKLKILKELKLNPASEDIERLMKLKNEIAIDNCFIAIRNRCWQEKYGEC